MADETVCLDLNDSPMPLLPFVDSAFAAAACCVSVDYLTQPIEVFEEVARVVQPGGVFVCTFSNRCFPTKAIRGWLGTDDEMHMTVASRLIGGPTRRRAGRPGGWRAFVAGRWERPSRPSGGNTRPR